MTKAALFINELWPSPLSFLTGFLRRLYDPGTAAANVIAHGQCFARLVFRRLIASSLQYSGANHSLVFL